MFYLIMIKFCKIFSLYNQINAFKTAISLLMACTIPQARLLFFSDVAWHSVGHLFSCILIDVCNLCSCMCIAVLSEFKAW